MRFRTTSRRDAVIPKNSSCRLMDFHNSQPATPCTALSAVQSLVYRGGLYGCVIVIIYCHVSRENQAVDTPPYIPFPSQYSRSYRFHFEPCQVMAYFIHGYSVARERVHARV